MTLFKKKQPVINPVRDKVAGELALWIVKIQLIVARYLNQKANGLSEHVKLTLLIFFCLLFSAVNIYLIAQSFTN